MASGKGSKKKRPAGKRPVSPTAKRPGAGGARTGAAAPAGGSPPPSTTAPTPAGGAPGRPKPTRSERLEAARRARRRKSLMVRAGVIGGVVVVIAAVVLAVAADRRANRREQEALTAGSCDYDTRADRIVNRHVPPASYEVDPPAGGDHDPGAAPAGFYTADRMPSDPQLVHSLEHGFVVFWHRPDLPEAEVQAIRGVFDDHSDDVIVVPRASLDVKVAATSWGRRLLCGEVEPETLSEFVDLYRNKSPEPGVR